MKLRSDLLGIRCEGHSETVALQLERQSPESAGIERKKRDAHADYGHLRLFDFIE